MYHHTPASLAVVEDDKARGIVLHRLRLEILLDEHLLHIGDAHHGDVGCTPQVIHLVGIYQGLYLSILFVGLGRRITLKRDTAFVGQQLAQKLLPFRPSLLCKQVVIEKT